ncbi:MAG TPA: acetolactate synthase small subunit [Candidatus Hydrogenedentes bacterium]|nr:acetolactate synthase small subunit [Candidatus Hydrogenedentota bacterium]HOV73711.1 acetolactate synthase small subunit [Candidatus Hydrogenedentota bacterium]HPC17108.1 acetolactate synthase small subunit [Candidatus Hydrogenedentota bacterium]HRT20509.1 acetolactate synthase small subunit [Candidatus Hydrogenedentota bacterium]HRT65286.1 acetolactate synthase small subunit [Candidatus Hydrogenedentota bacterium]
MKHTISVLVENHFGVLARVSALFSARGYNIDSLCVGETERPDVSRMTVVVRGDDRVLEQIIKQLNKLVDTIEVRDLTSEDFVERELVMIKVGVGSKQRSEVVEIASIYRAKVVDCSANSMILEVTGSEGKVSAFIDMLRPFGIREIVRTGEIAITRAS